MTFIEEIVQELLNDRQKTDEARICEKLHIPRFLLEYDFCDFAKETNKRLIQAGTIGHYKITDSNKVEIAVHDFCIRINSTQGRWRIGRNQRRIESSIP